MKKRRHTLPFLTFIFLSLTIFNPACASEAGWTEKKLGRVILKADKAANRHKWTRAIKYGEQALLGSEALDRQNDARYINSLKNLAKYYDKAGRLQEIAPRVIKLYDLSNKYFGKKHNTTSISRRLYYKLLIANQKYGPAISVVLENISLLEDNKNDDFRRLHYLKQLYSLYGIAGRFAAQEKAILEYQKLSHHLLGRPDEDSLKSIRILAKNYCRQNKMAEFHKLKITHGLPLSC